MRCLRAVSQTAPGRLWASFTPVLRPVREVQSLDWDRRGRVTPARPASQEAWPGAESVGASQLARTAVERRKASAPEAPANGNIRLRGARRAPLGTAKRVRAFRRSASLLFGRHEGLSCSGVANLGCETHRENEDAYSLLPACGEKSRSEATRMRGPLSESDRRGSSEQRCRPCRNSAPSGEAPSPQPSPRTRGEGSAP